MDYFSQLLHQHSLKSTPQRLAILQQIDKDGHITIDELYKSIKEKFSSISVATIYKNINALLKAKIVKEVPIENQKAHYEITKDEHIHLVCKACGKIEDSFLDTAVMIETVAKESDYTIDKASLFLYGVCSECKNIK